MSGAHCGCVDSITAVAVLYRVAAEAGKHDVQEQQIGSEGEAAASGNVKQGDGNSQKATNHGLAISTR